MASTDRQTAGLVPVTYIKVVKPTNQIENSVANANVIKSVSNASALNSKPTESVSNPAVEAELEKIYSGQEL